MSLSGASEGGGEPLDARVVKRSLRERAGSSTLWTVGGSAAMQLMRLGSNAVLSRLLFPGIFGLMALVNAIMQGLELLSDVGTRASIVRHERGDERRFLDTVWTIQVMRGTSLGLICLALAGPTAGLYDTPALRSVLIVSALIPVANGLRGTAMTSLERHLELGKWWGMLLGARVIGVGVSIAWAAAAPTIWALVAGQLAYASSLLVFSHAFTGGLRDRFAWDRAARVDVVSFGRWIFLSTALGFCAERIDRMILGKLITFDVLGIYSLAAMLAFLPMEVVSKLGNAVLFPLLSGEYRKDPEEMRRRLGRARRPLLATAVTALVGLFVGAQLFFEVLYDSRYHEAGWMAQALVGWGWFTVLRATVDRGVLALGDSKRLAIARGVQLVATVIGIIVGFRTGGVFGLIMGVTFGALCSYLVVLHAAHGHGLRVLRQDLDWTLLISSLMAASFVACRLADEAHPAWGRWMPVPVTAAVGLGMFLSLRPRGRSGPEETTG